MKVFKPKGKVFSVKNSNFVPDRSDLGRIVCSAAGRDEGEYFVIVEILNETAVLIANGTGRSVQTPKKKNKKHLTFTGESVRPHGEPSKPVFTDTELAAVLEKYNQASEAIAENSTLTENKS